MEKEELTAVASLVSVLGELLDHYGLDKYTITSLYQMCKITYGPDLKIMQVSIAHSRPACSEKFDDFLR